MNPNVLPSPLTFWDKMAVPLPWMLWAVIALLFSGIVLWAIDRWVFRKFNILPELRKGNVAIAIVVAAVIWAVVTLFAKGALASTDRYDGHFQRWGVHYFGDQVDWRQWKAQGMTESGLNPGVCSPAGACGLMQLMPATAAELQCDQFRPREAIECAVRYMLWQTRRWTAPRPEQERLAFAFASYNAGLGFVLRFQREARAAGTCDADRYLCVEPHAWKEPRDYVRRIARWCTRFHGWGCWPGGEY